MLNFVLHCGLKSGLNSLVLTVIQNGIRVSKKVTGHQSVPRKVADT